MSFVDNIHHNNHQSSSYSKFWLSSVSSPELLEQLSYVSSHHIGDLYRKDGMKINLNDLNHEEAKKIKSMMQFIRGKIGNLIFLKIKAEYDKLFPDNKGGINQELSLGQNQKQGNLSKEQQKIMFFNMEFNRSLNPRKMLSPDLLEETYIKAIAVSILAETNGNSELAESVLSNGGLRAIKQLDVKDLRNLLSDLQVESGKEMVLQKE